MEELELEYRAQAVEEDVIEGEIVSPNGTAVARPLPMQQVKTAYVTAMAVQEQRSLSKIERQLYQEAALLGDEAFYGWTVKDEKTGKTSLIGGGTINLAMVAIRCFGNCAIDQDPPVETRDAWFFPVRVIDLQKGFTLTRYGRYGRRAIVYGKLDDERKERVRFEIGQSIALRNGIFDFIPKWLITGAIKHAKSGVRKRLEEYIAKSGIDKARQILIDRLADKGVTVERILDKMQRPTVGALTVDDLVMMQGDAKQLEDSAELPENLYPEVERETQPSGEGEAGQAGAPKTRTEEAKAQLLQQQAAQPPRDTAASGTGDGGSTTDATAEQLDELEALAGQVSEKDVAEVKRLRAMHQEHVALSVYQDSRNKLLAKQAEKAKAAKG